MGDSQVSVPSQGRSVEVHEGDAYDLLENLPPLSPLI